MAREREGEREGGDKLTLSKNSVYRLINLVFQSDKLSLLKNFVYRVKNSVYRR